MNLQTPYQPTPTSFAELRVELRDSAEDSALATVRLPDSESPMEPMEIPLNALADASEIDATQGSAILRGTSADPTQLLRDIGRRLFQTLFGGRLRRHFVQATEIATTTRRPLAVVIAADSQRLLLQPWELLCDDQTKRSNEFLALGGWPVVRARLGAAANPQRQGTPTVRVLVLLADLPFPVERDLTRIREIASGSAVLDVVEARVTTLNELRSAITTSGAQVVHYAGLGSAGKPNLQISTADRIDGDQFRDALAALPDLGLVVLNGALTDGVAAALAADVPAVVGVRGQIRGDACAEFADGLYRALAAGVSVRGSVCAGRQQVRYRLPQDRYWSLPVHWDRGDAVLVSESAPAWSDSGTGTDDDAEAGEEVALLLEKRALAQRNLEAVKRMSMIQQVVPETFTQQETELASQIAELDNLLAERGK